MKPVKAAACVVFAGHMAATCAANVPAGSAISSISATFQPYLELTGVWQSWTMFTTIPYLVDYDIVLETSGPDGRFVDDDKMGVTVPGLLRYDRALRTQLFFTRVFSGSGYTEYARPYLRNVCAELRAKRGRGGQTFRFRESYDRLRGLDEIRADGMIGKTDDVTSMSFTCTE